MKAKTLVTSLSCVFLLVSPVFAQVGDVSSDSRSSASSSSNVSNSGNNASVSAPGLTSSGYWSCAGSTSVGFAAFGFGISAGGTKEMEGCEARTDALVLDQLGHSNTALLRMCQNRRVALALAYDGKPCPPDYYTPEQRRAIWGAPTPTPPPLPTVSPTARGVETQTSVTPASGQQFVVIRRMKISDMPSGSQYRTPDGVIHTKP